MSPIVLLLLFAARTRLSFAFISRSPSLRRNNLAVRYVCADGHKVEVSYAADSSCTSHIAAIRSRNLAGAVNEGSGKVITISLGAGPNLVAVTGETGSGKSLLIAKVADLVTGGKATSTSVPSNTDNPHSNTSSAGVEMVLRLSEPHISMVQRSLAAIGLDPEMLFDSETDDLLGTLTLRRELVVAEQRLKSICTINGHTVSLNGLRTVASPLLAIVDASAAAAALAKQNSRMSIVDTAVPDPIVSYARLTKAEYRKCRGYRQNLEKELSNRLLPVSISDVDDEDKDIELLQHWVDELDAFEARMARFCTAIESPTMSGCNLAAAASTLSSSSWFDDASSESIDNEAAFSSALYTNILDFREAVKSVDQQLEAARNACDALSSLSSAESAITALQRTRNYLFDATVNEHSESAVASSAEKSHDLLNSVEEALKACIKSLDDERTGLVSVLESLRASVDISIEDIDIIIADWNTLARKHGMLPFSLPACHKALRAELDGNVEARTLLPEALAKEKEALEKFEAACGMLTSARQKVAKQLSLAVSQRLPSLGMEGSTFLADLQASTRKCTDASVYGSNARLGTDSIDFLLLHRTAYGKSGEAVTSAPRKPRDGGGKLDVVASSGEKARILLAIECELPGSIGAANRARASDDLESKDLQIRTDYDLMVAPPVSVIYDEIDAHVGGRAAVAVANMLADQSRARPNRDVKSQVVSITHSPSVAAIADMHILVQRQDSSNGERGHVPVRVTVIDGAERRKELARMASGDLAPDEAELFADALLRDGAKRRGSPVN